MTAEHCLNCQKTGFPLLACDDPDIVVPVGVRPRFCPECMIGNKVKVFWPVDNCWYTGVVEKYDDRNEEHLLRYSDGDTEWVKIGSEGGVGPATGNRARELLLPEGAPSPIITDRPVRFQDSERWTHALPHPATKPSFYPTGAPPPQIYPHHYGYHYAGQPYASTGETYPGYPPVVTGSIRHPPPAHLAGPPPAASPEGRTDSSPSPPFDNSVAAALKRKSGPKVWTKEEDQLLLQMVQTMKMPMKWSLVAQSLPERTGKQCRERYVNHLNPRLKVADWSTVEDATIFAFYNSSGSHWAQMSKMIPGRTDNGIKNRFHNLRRQLEREDDHRLRLNSDTDFPEQIRLDRIRELPVCLRGKSDDLWDIQKGIGVLAAQSVLGGGIARNNSRFGPFRSPHKDERCVRCGLHVPSVQTGREICTKSGWCTACTRIPPHVSGNLLRECLNLRRSDPSEGRDIIESWEEFVASETPITH